MALEAEDESGVEKVVFRERAGAGEDVAPFHVGDDLGFVEVGDVVFLVVAVVGHELVFGEGVVSREESLGVGARSFGGVDGRVGLNGGEAAELVKELVVPRTLGVTEEKEAAAPSRDGECCRKEVGECPPEPGWASLDELLEVSLLRHQGMRGRFNGETYEQFVPSRAGS